MAYWYLAGVGLLMLAVAWGTPHRQVRVWIFFVTAGAITLGDLVPMAILNLYEYTPGLLPRGLGHWFGELMAECLFVPAVLSFRHLAPRRWRVLSGALTVALFAALEWLLMRLGMYRHNRWSFTATAVLFSVYLIALDRAVDSLVRRGYDRLHRAALVGSSVYYALTLWGMLVTGVLGLASIRLGMAANKEMDEMYTNFILVGPPFLLVGLTGVWMRWLRRPAMATLVAAGFALWFSALEALGVRHSYGVWNPLLDGLVIGAAMFGLAHLDRWFESSATT